MIFIRSAGVLARSISLALTLSVVTVSHARGQDTTRAAPPAIRIDFQDADLRAVITALAEAGGLNVMYGEIPSRPFTLHLPQAVSRADILPLLRSIASSNGLRVVADGNLIRGEARDARPAANTSAPSPPESVPPFI